MEHLWLDLLLMSLAGSVLGLVYLACKPIAVRICTAAQRYYLWLTVLFVMVVPVSFSLPAIETEGVIEMSMIQKITGVADDLQQPVRMLEHLSIGRILSFVWLCGALVFLGVRLVDYGRFYRWVIRCGIEMVLPAEFGWKVMARRVELSEAPMMIGLIRPILLLPMEELSYEQLRYVVLHERVHAMHHDLWYQWAVVIVFSFHWFNPLTYLFMKQINEERELACDAAVIREFSEEQCSGYMRTILDLISCGIPRELTTQMAGGKNLLIRRFSAIRKNRTSSRVKMLMSMGLALILTVGIWCTMGVVNGQVTEPMMKQVEQRWTAVFRPIPVKKKEVHKLNDRAQRMEKLQAEKTSAEAALAETKEASVSESVLERNILPLQEDRGTELSLQSGEGVDMGSKGMSVGDKAALPWQQESGPESEPEQEPELELELEPILQHDVDFQMEETGSGFVALQQKLEKQGKKLTVQSVDLKEEYRIAPYALAETQCIISGIFCDEKGEIHLCFQQKGENLLEILFVEREGQEQVGKFRILANGARSYTFKGFSRAKQYDLIIESGTKQEWEIVGQCMIY